MRVIETKLHPKSRERLPRVAHGHYPDAAREWGGNGTEIMSGNQKQIIFMEVLRKPQQARQLISDQLRELGLPELSQSQFYRVKRILSDYQQSVGKRPTAYLYSSDEIRLLYMVARLQLILKNLKLTAITFRLVIKSLPPGTLFRDRFTSFSSIDSFILVEMAGYQACA